VPRESFLGPAPWKIVRLSEIGGGYIDVTDPVRLYDNVLVAIDPERRLNNGEPAALLRWLDSLELSPGERFLHVGCGVGYYTAVAAEAVRPGGFTVGIEIDSELAERARRNTRGADDIAIVGGDGSAAVEATFDAIIVNAGATGIPAQWLDALRPGGRLLLPLTVSVPNQNIGAGWMLLVRRSADRFEAEFHSPVGIYHCAGARSEYGEARLRRLFAARSSGVFPLRRDAHREDASCALHGAGSCLAHPARH